MGNENKGKGKGKGNSGSNALAPIDNTVPTVADSVGNAIANTVEATITPVAETVIGVAKVLIATSKRDNSIERAANYKPSESITIAGKTVPNPLFNSRGASKRALAYAIVQSILALGYNEQQAVALAKQLVVLTGVGYCHSTLHRLAAGASDIKGYIKPQMPWWSTASNKANASKSDVVLLCNTIAQGVIGTCNGDFMQAMAKATRTVEALPEKWDAKVTVID
jgi:hypothetical protein